MIGLQVIVQRHKLQSTRQEHTVLSVTDANGCMNTDSTVVAQVDELLPVIDGRSTKLFVQGVLPSLK